MRYSFYFYSVLLVMSGLAFGKDINPLNSSNQMTTQTQVVTSNHVLNETNKTKQATQNKTNSSEKSIDDKTPYVFHLEQFDKKNIFVSATAIYGFMNGGGLSGTSYAETTTTSGAFNNYIPKVGANWGFQAKLGYQTNGEKTLGYVLNFTSLNTSRVQTVGVQEQGDYLYNELTQFGNVLTTGFSKLAGPATASSTAGYMYQNLDFLAITPYLEGSDIFGIHFYKGWGLKWTHLTKSLMANYTGLANSGTTLAPVYDANIQDTLMYGANFYGLGGAITLGGNAQLIPKVKWNVDGSFGLEAGFFNSHYIETASSNLPVTVGDIKNTNFTDHEMHHSQAWTPVILNVETSVEIELINSKKHQIYLTSAGGFSSEYILPTFASDSYAQAVGQTLARLNNSLSLTYLFARANLSFD